MHVTPPSLSQGLVLQVIVRVNGVGYGAQYVCPATPTAKAAVEALTPALNAALPATSVAVTEDDAKLILTGEAVGLDFEVDAIGGFTVATITAAAAASAPRELLGVAQRIHNASGLSLEPGTAFDGKSYPGESTVSIVRHGTVWVEVETAVVAGDLAYTRITATDTYPAGGWRNDTDSGKAQRFTGGRFRSAAAAGGVAQLELVPVAA